MKIRYIRCVGNLFLYSFHSFLASCIYFLTYLPSLFKLCRILLGVVIHMCRRHAAPTQAQVRLHWTTWRSDLSSVNYRRSCLSCCCSKGVEFSAKRCYAGPVAVGVQEQAEDILVPQLLRNCLTLKYIIFLFLVIISPQNSSLCNSFSTV